MLASMIFLKEPFFHGQDNYDQVMYLKQRCKLFRWTVKNVTFFKMFSMFYIFVIDSIPIIFECIPQCVVPFNPL